MLPSHPIVTLALASDLLGVTKPTAAKVIGALTSLGMLVETTGRQRDRVYAYQAYLDALTAEEP
jgi:Fic family protein